MRLIKSDSGFLLYQKIFRQLLAHNSLILLWQVRLETGERKVVEARLNSFHMDTGLIHLETPRGNDLNLSFPIYCYSRDAQFIFKTEIKNLKLNVVSILLPEELQLLETPDVSYVHGSGSGGENLSNIWMSRVAKSDASPPKNYVVVKSMRDRTARDQEFLTHKLYLTLDEEDKIYAEKRKSPRKRPKANRKVKIKSNHSDEIYRLKLFDLSQGGIGFITAEAYLFSTGTSISIIGFEDFKLDDPLVATVVSQRSTDLTMTEFKIGCKFNEGQA